MLILLHQSSMVKGYLHLKRKSKECSRYGSYLTYLSFPPAELKLSTNQPETSSSTQTIAFWQLILCKLFHQILKILATICVYYWLMVIQSTYIMAYRKASTIKRITITCISLLRSYLNWLNTQQKYSCMKIAHKIYLARFSQSFRMYGKN